MSEIIKKSSIRTINPYTNEIVKEFTEMSAEVIDEKITTAETTFKVWKKTPLNERAKLLHKVAAIMREKKESLAQLATLEMGKLYREALGEVELCAKIFDYYADNGEELLADKTLDPKIGEGFISYEPLGIHLSVQPWNFPFYQLTRSAAPSVMAGNTVLLKHASNVPQCGLAMEEIFLEAGAPEGLYTNLFVPGRNIESIVADDRIKLVSLTGSEAAGASIAAAAGKYIKRSTLELGGSDPLIVLDDANLDDAVNAAVYGRMHNAGQVCISPKRVIVLREIAEEFEKRAKSIFSSLKVGDPMDSQTQVPPLSSEKAAEEILSQVEKAVAEGATLVSGGKRIDRPGAFIEPTFLKDIKPGNSAYTEEIFGPVFMLYIVKDEAEAIEVANATPFGLGASIFSNDIIRARKLAKSIDSGMVFINKVTGSLPELPFGGTKKSGYGRELSPAGIYEVVNSKLVYISEKGQ